MPYQVIGLALLGLLLAGCAASPEHRVPPPVFPPPPEEARLIYDGSLRSSKDIEARGFKDVLQQVATGVQIDPAGLGKPYGVAVHKGRIYVTDTQQRAIVLFDLSARRFRLLASEGDGRVIKPMGIDIARNGDLYVADITARQIKVYDAEGRFLRSIGDKRLLRRPSGVALSPDDRRLYVVDTGGLDSDEHHVRVFNPVSGELLQTIGRRGTANGEFNIPLQADTAPDGTLYVVDSGNFRVQAFTPDGRFARSFGSLGRRSGQFSRPKGIAVDPQGNVYVVDTAFGNFQIFDPEGRLLLFVGYRGTSGGPARYMLPAGIDVDEAGRVYVVDQFFRKVDIFRPAGLEPLPHIPKF